ncbi:MAG TPA: NfeD family protein [Micavibrio sp.]|jgi:hypothetical protein
MIAFLSSLTCWHWLVFGVGLMAVETFLPGAFFLWPGLAATLVGLICILLPLPWTVAVPLWATLSVVTVTGWIFYRKKHPRAETPNTLNRRGHEFIGQTLTLDKPVINGKGEIHAGDTIWRVVSTGDLPAGMTVRVTALDGTALRIEKA